MATDPATVVASGEGDLYIVNRTVSGEPAVETIVVHRFCKATATLTTEKTQQDVGTACDFDDETKKFYQVSKTTGERFSLSVETPLKRGEDPWDIFGSGTTADDNDNIEALFLFYKDPTDTDGLDGFGVHMMWTCSEGPTFSDNGPEGVWNVSATLRSQSIPLAIGAVTIPGTP
jgi:hypothetical protein